jgi:hypothetical protein
MKRNRKNIINNRRNIIKNRRNNKRDFNSDLELSWAQIDQNNQELWKQLGYTENIWDNQLWPNIFTFNWNQLTDNEKSAAEQLGYDENSWNEQIASISSDDVVNVTGEEEEEEEVVEGEEEEVVDPYNSVTNDLRLNWDKIDPDRIELWEILGHTRENWESSDWPESTFEFWDDLNEDLQSAAKQLGYDKDRWNEQRELELEKKNNPPEEEEEEENNNPIKNISENTNLIAGIAGFILLLIIAIILRIRMRISKRII